MENIPFETCYETLSLKFAATGLPTRDAEAIAEELLYAEVTGRTAHGFEMIEALLKRAREVRDTPLSTSHPWPASTVITANGHPGPMVARTAADNALVSAEEFGIGIAVSISASPFLAAGYQPYRIASSRGYFALATTVAKARVAVFGSSEALLGTNPIAIALPSVQGSPPILFDSAMTLMAAAEVRRAARIGDQIPLGVALDIDGNDTTDPVAAQDGAMLPFGGYRGSGLAVVLEGLVGALAGVKCGKNRGEMRAMLHIVVRPDLARDRDDVFAWIAGFEHDISSARHDGPEEPRFPGQRSHELWTRAITFGVTLSSEASAIYASLSN